MYLYSLFVWWVICLLENSLSFRLLICSTTTLVQQKSQYLAPKITSDFCHLLRALKVHQSLVFKEKLFDQCITYHQLVVKDAKMINQSCRGKVLHTTVLIFINKPHRGSGHYIQLVHYFHHHQSGKLVWYPASWAKQERHCALGFKELDLIGKTWVWFLKGLTIVVSETWEMWFTEEYGFGIHKSILA